MRIFRIMLIALVLAGFSANIYGQEVAFENHTVSEYRGFLEKFKKLSESLSDLNSYKEYIYDVNGKALKFDEAFPESHVKNLYVVWNLEEMANHLERVEKMWKKEYDALYDNEKLEKEVDNKNASLPEGSKIATKIQIEESMSKLRSLRSDHAARSLKFLEETFKSDQIPEVEKKTYMEKFNNWNKKRGLLK